MLHPPFFLLTWAIVLWVIEFSETLNAVRCKVHPEKREKMSDNQNQNQNQNQGRGGFAVTVEVADGNGRNVYFQSLRQKLRGRWAIAEVSRRGDGMRTTGETIQQIPDIPGQHVTVRSTRNGAELVISDPLNDRPELCRRVKSVLSKSFISRAEGDLTGVPDTRRPLDADEAKTLLIELQSMLKSKMVLLVDGEIPGDMDKVPGRQLFDPAGNQQSGSKPRYADEADKFFADRNIT